MKLLFDQDISYRIVRKLSALFPKSEQVKRIGFDNKSDRFLWEFAKRSGFTIVTFDSDFHALSTRLGHPPKLIWVKSNDQTTQSLENTIRRNLNVIADFEGSNLSCIQLVAN